MFILKKTFFKRANVWTWLCFNVLPASLPFIFSIATALATRSPVPSIGTYIKLNDLIFIGLTMTISNFNTRQIKIPARKKDEAMFWSLVSLLVFGFTLGLTNFNPDVPLGLKLIVLGLLSQLVKVNFQIYTRKTSPTIKSSSNDTCIN